MKKITPTIDKALLAKAAQGWTARKLAEWVEAEHGVKVSHQAIGERLRKSAVAKVAKAPGKAEAAGSPEVRAPKRVGRRTDLTPEMQATFVEALGKYGTIATAAELSGITATTVANWLERGRANEEPFLGFLVAVTRARGEFKQSALDTIRAGAHPNGATDWKALAWILERILPDEFGPSQAVNIKLAKELEATLDDLKAKLPPDVYRQVLSAIAGDSGEVAIGGAAADPVH